MKTGKMMNLTANKNNVMKNSNHTEKENKTMRNTLKIRTKILAGLLAAATTVSAFTAVGTTAFAEETRVPQVSLIANHCISLFLSSSAVV